MGFVNSWSDKAEIPAGWFLDRLGVAASTFYSWRARQGQANRHNGWIPRDFWLEDWEREAILAYHDVHPDQGYRRLSFMMLDEDMVAVSPSTVWRVLHGAGKLHRWSRTTSKGSGFDQPVNPHEHWHIDVSYLNISGTFYYLCSVLDGCSRYVVHWELGPSMTEADLEVVLQKARELYPQARPRVISDNGPQFIAKDFKEFIRHCGMTHVTTSPYYPQSNGKIERWHQTLKRECIRPGTPLTLDDARRLVAGYVEQYNRRRLHSSLGYVTPEAKLNGQDQTIFAERTQKLHAARQRRQTVCRARKEAHAILSIAG